MTNPKRINYRRAPGGCGFWPMLVAAIIFLIAMGAMCTQLSLVGAAAIDGRRYGAQQYLPLVAGGNVYANPIPDVTPAPTPTPRTPPNYCPPWDESITDCEQPKFTGDFDRIVTERADHYTWCELQKIECYLGEVDPEAIFVYPSGWTVTGVVYFVMSDPEHNLGTYYVFTGGSHCKDGYCAEIDGNTAHIWRDLAMTTLTIDAVDLWREKGPILP